MLLPAMAIIYVLTGTLDFNMSGISGGIFPAEADRMMVIIAYLLCLFGFAKAGISKQTDTTFFNGSLDNVLLKVKSPLGHPLGCKSMLA
jgi:hypothetical protein